MALAQRSRGRHPILAALAVGLAAALPAAVTTSQAAAGPAPILDSVGASNCYYKGKQYSDGAIKRHDNGILYRCGDGLWYAIGG